MLGDILKRLRQSKGLTQTELAKKLDLTRGTYAHYEINKRQPDYETLHKIADFYNVSTDYLLGRTDKPRPAEPKTVRVAGQEFELSSEEYKVFEEMKKHPIMFHDLAKNPEKKVKQLIKMWKFQREMMEDDDEEGEGFGEFADD
ncbi:helix-turn-helix transcriptional regulator [Bacillus tianshenii]|nr:helix-turn-helix transcriptional regulator [Bacillus tianshenii]